MSQPPKCNVTFVKNRKIDIAHILREHIVDYQKKYPLQGQHYKIVYDLLSCRTAYLGGHIDRCDQCEAERVAYNSCRNRHCPTCQNMPRERWLKARKQELLPLTYFHTVFTLPHELNPIIVSNKKIMLDILFKSVAETLLSFGHNLKNGLGGKLGFIAILHSWDQRLNAHFHLHCLIAGGAMTEDGKDFKSCKHGYLFNEEALGLVFRGKFIEYMSQAYQSGSLTFPGICAPYRLWRQGEYLEDGAVKSYQLLLRKTVPCFDVLIESELQQRADRVVAVERKTVPVRDQHQEKVQKDFFLLQRGQETIGEETVRDKAEPTLNTPDALSIKDLFSDHGRLLIYVS